MRRAVDRTLYFGKVYCVVLMLLMLVLAFVQVVRRYCFNVPWMWSDEMGLLLLGWFSYPAVVFNIWTDDHFCISSVYDKFPPRVRCVLDVLRHLIIGGFMGAFGWYGAVLTRQYWVKPMATMPLPKGIAYIPVALGGIFGALFCLANLVGTFLPPQAGPLGEGGDAA